MRMTTATLQRWSTRLVALIRLGRPKFLAGGVILYWLGVAMAWYSGVGLRWREAVWGQFIVTFTQLMVHYSNDYFDFEADAQNPTPTAWSGGSRVLQAAMLPRQTAKIAAIVLAVVVIVAIVLLALIANPGPLAVSMLVVAFVLSWQYSAPPLRLHSRGVGEIAGAFVVSGLTPLVGFYLQTRQLTALPILASLPLCCLQFNMLLSVDIPDLEGDAAVNKRTLVVRLGRPKIARLYVTVLAFAYFLLIVVTILGLPPLVAGCFSATFPLALWLIWRTMKGDMLRAPAWSRFAFLSIALLMSAALLELAGFIMLAIRR